MKKNVGGLDKKIRIILGGILLIAGILLAPTGFGIALIVIGAVLLLTGWIGFCGLYTILKINTCKEKTEPGKEQTAPDNGDK